MEYLGNSTYKLYLGKRKLELSLDEVYDIMEQLKEDIDFEKNDRVSQLISFSYDDGYDEGYHHGVLDS